MSDGVAAVVVGAGVVGLAVARALAQSARDLVVLEADGVIGSGVSSRNSEVIHAGIYYPEGSLKARLCVAGRVALYHYCRSRGVPHRRTGKLIVAADDSEIPALKDIERKAAANGVLDLSWADAAQARRIEPQLACTAALYSPSTGIVDSHQLMLSLQGEAEDAGAVVALRHRLTRAEALAGGGFELQVTGPDDAVSRLRCRGLVNAAGLEAQAVARAIDGLDPAKVPRLYLSRGCYFTLSGKAPFTRLVYPIPQSAGLGVHLTLDMGGAARFGPDAEWIDAVDFSVDPRRADSFYAEIRRYWPALKDGALQPGYAGIRPKLQAPGGPPRDFLIQGPADHGLPGLVNLFGIESPGLTASLAIANEVRRQLDGAA